MLDTCRSWPTAARVIKKGGRIVESTNNASEACEHLIAPHPVWRASGSDLTKKELHDVTALSIKSKRRRCSLKSDVLEVDEQFVHLRAVCMRSTEGAIALPADFGTETAFKR